MKLSPLQRYWLDKRDKYNLHVDAPYSLALSDGSRLPIEVCLKGYGSKHGMLLVSDCAMIEKHCSEIVEMGYSYACLSQPSESEIESDDKFDLLLEDWGKVQ